ncbi:MAG: PAC2 family protein [Propionibacteriaceae bacterium]|jgi:hypothetical protein|nr:PAC2 family protein [Propionibacteriaceae bacterium]
MLDPTQLFNYVGSVDQRLVRADTLVVTLGSYLDAGHAQALLNEHLTNSLPNSVLGHFDADQLFDYAGHRPQIVFDKDHFESFAAPEIALRQLSDADGKPFLLLSGPEPSLQWERTAAMVEHLIDQFDISQTVIVHGFPAPSPHTRPVLVTKFASDPALIPLNSGLPATFQMSASFTSLLTMRLGERGKHVVGLTAHVPHYLAGLDYPAAALSLMREVCEVAGLQLPEADLEERSQATVAEISAQVDDHDELKILTETLEQHYDAMLTQRGLPVRQEDIPTAEELGAQFESFLRELENKNNPGPEGFQPPVAPKS